MAESPANQAPNRLLDNVVFGENVIVCAFTNLYGCRLGDNTRVGPFVEIQRDVAIGSNCKISSHTFICSGVDIADEVFIGHGVIFVNDKYPRAISETGSFAAEGDWTMLRTTVARRASVGSGAVILGGVSIGEQALIGAGAVVTRDVPPNGVVVGNPAHPIGEQ